MQGFPALLTSPGKLTLLSLTTSSASVSLVSVCLWLCGVLLRQCFRLSVSTCLPAAAQESVCSPGPDFPFARPSPALLVLDSSPPVRPSLWLLPASEMNCSDPNTSRFSSTHSPSLKPRDCGWALSPKNELLPALLRLAKFLICLCINKGHYQRSLISRVVRLSPKYTHHTGPKCLCYNTVHDLFFSPLPLIFLIVSISWFRCLSQ